MDDKDQTAEYDSKHGTYKAPKLPEPAGNGATPKPPTPFKLENKE